MVVSFKTAMENTKLADFDNLHDAVVFNSLRNVPDRLKIGKKEETNMVLDFFY